MLCHPPLHPRSHHHPSSPHELRDRHHVQAKHASVASGGGVEHQRSTPLGVILAWLHVSTLERTDGCSSLLRHDDAHTRSTTAAASAAEESGSRSRIFCFMKFDQKMVNFSRSLSFHCTPTCCQETGGHTDKSQTNGAALQEHRMPT